MQFQLKMAIASACVITMPTVANAQISLEPIGTYETGVFDESAAEIVAHDPDTQRLFIVNALAATIDVLDISDPTTPVLAFQIDATPYGAVANSVAVKDGLVAIAIEADPKTDPGQVAFFDVDGSFIKSVTVGALPDMVVFSPNGRYVLTANEGEPNDDYSIDPPGSVSVIDLRRGIDKLSQNDVKHIGFELYDLIPQLLTLRGVRIFGPGASPSLDLEPEYIAIDDASLFAYVSLQENNGIAVINLRSKRVTRIIGLGVKNHAQHGNGLDASDRDDAINIANWPVYGMYQPDTIATYRWRGRTFIVTANEGDARDYDTFAEESRVKDLALDPIAFPDAATLQEDENLGRLTVTTVDGDKNGDGLYEKLFVFGARSFSIWHRSGWQVFDSGDDFEQTVANTDPDFFNSNNDENNFDSRSDNKGPEPEALVLGEFNGRLYAFIGFERQSGIVVYDITNPFNVHFETYVSNRDFTADPESSEVGDLGPEGMVFINPSDSPNGEPLLIVANEVSGTTTIWRVFQN